MIRIDTEKSAANNKLSRHIFRRRILVRQRCQDTFSIFYDSRKAKKLKFGRLFLHFTTIMERRYVVKVLDRQTNETFRFDCMSGRQCPNESEFIRFIKPYTTEKVIKLLQDTANYADDKCIITKIFCPACST